MIRLTPIDRALSNPVSTSIRPCTLSDAAPLASLYRQCFPHHVRSLLGESVCRTYFESVLSHKAYQTLCAIDGGEILGFVVIHYGDYGTVSSRWMLRCWKNALLAIVIRPWLAFRYAARKLWESCIKCLDSGIPVSSSENTRGGYIDFIGVSENSRGKGIGAQLVKASIRHAYESSIVRIGLTVSEDNEAAISLYKALGFQRSGYDPHEKTLCFKLILKQGAKPPESLEHPEFS